MKVANKYNKEVYDFIKKHVKNRTNAELLELVNKKFGNIFTLTKLKAYKCNHKLFSNLTGYFPKGYIPFNKGRKMPSEVYEKVKATMFQKGNTPHNHRPLGSERETRDGFIEIKTEEPNKWELKHRVIWKQLTGKNIPKDSIITFLDGNTKNFAIDNLACITKNENARLNQNKLRSEYGEITQTNINIIRLDNLVKTLKQRG